MKRHNIECVSLDLRNGDDQDVCGMRNLLLVKRLMRSNLVEAVMLAPPCSSFSLARNARPVRDNAHPRGLPGLNSEDAIKVAVGNRCLDAAVKIFKWSTLFGIPACVENPLGSHFWRVPEGAKLLDLGHVLKVHQCSFGAHYRKATKLFFNMANPELSWNLCHEKSFRCHGRHGFCSFRPGHKHEVLQGRFTTRAARYPGRLASFIARNILQT